MSEIDDKNSAASIGKFVGGFLGGVVGGVIGFVINSITGILSDRRPPPPPRLISPTSKPKEDEEV
jgi:hypothetical protein